MRFEFCVALICVVLICCGWCGVCGVWCVVFVWIGAVGFVDDVCSCYGVRVRFVACDVLCLVCWCV